MRTYAAAAFFVALCAAVSLGVFEPQTNSGFTFNVDPVELDLEPVTRRQLDPVDLCRGAWGSQLEACYLSSALSTKHCFYGLSTDAFNRHGLIDAFLTSFTKHKRLVLRPDDIFFPLLDAAATHVFQQGEEARSLFVNHTGKKALTVARHSFSPPGGAVNANDWLSVLPEFRSQIIASTHPGSVEPALPSFTTTDVITSAAFSGTLMRALQNFFSYEVITMCGIPSITLLGSEHDWADLRARFLKLAESWMGLTPSTCRWTNAVDGMLAQFESARAGRVDVEWWRSIFKYNSPRGGSGEHNPYLTGHITRLFPWYNAGGKHATWVGIRDEVSTGVSSGSGSVPVKWTVGPTSHNMTLWSGFAGVCMDEAQEQIAPAMGVAITSETPDTQKPRRRRDRHW